MTLGKTLISNEVSRLKRGVKEAKRAIQNVKGNGSTTGYRKTIDLHEKSIAELEKDLRKL